ncbi:MULTISPECIES: efflux RND transporter periplasmic adaptor subunit [Commensalibacter]|uniref:Multidrug resistance transporter HlyD/EmrA/FusE n=2 Tax=Commensalibacter TaxID=1079922 RepID=W7DU59_9PROT|nr:MULTISPECIES: HlyD family secretion protein [Commensalibacter]EUK17793.1 multidrug resistance transporter HlyD/EmrA/FusE [Commensalibacter papalotli (ex Servin-Garciduenas et al. 2014)]CAI3943975.1 Multidrug resistance efflux pump EmrA (EmrA) (PDB:4TKO) [Commensalibacter papalotli (ex Botero et al. 2024)]CAI3946910.1 Multidrug resistance efflux pump EmrA (EmrA) (PDB:4TKO) [Commensalibacter papalotli (ex Botero et al. 2024)]
MFSLSNIIRISLTLIVVIIAIILGVTLWDTYMIAPWTRDGRVRVYVVKIAPEVAGTVVQVPVKDNQYVRKGEPLFIIDPARFRIAIQQAQASLENAEANLTLQRRNAMRRKGLEGIVSTEEKEDFNTKVATAQASVDSAKASLDEAKLNLQRSILYSPVNGYITNLNLRVGDYVSTGQSYLSVVDADSFWVYGYFEETKMWGIHVGDVARIKLMGYKQILPGHVVSIARGINDANADTDAFGLQNVNPIFTWVRLAQRIPVRIHIDHVPDTMHLSAGMTATVSIGPETKGRRGILASWLQNHL